MAVVEAQSGVYVPEDNVEQHKSQRRSGCQVNIQISFFLSFFPLFLSSESE